MDTILVTGATGFLGRAVCQRLRAEFAVIGIGRNERIGLELLREGIEFHACDLADVPLLRRLCSRVQAVVHCAARSSAWGRPEDFYRDNVRGTAHLLQACRGAPLQRLVHISSPSIYAALGDRLGIRETDPLPKRSLNDYAHSKRLAENLMDQAYEVQELPVITLRPQAIFGPHDPAILPRLIEANARGGIPVFHGRRAILDATFIDNAVQAIYLALKARPEYCGQHYNVTNDEPIALIPFLQELFPRLGLCLRTKPLPYPLARLAAGTLERFHRQFLMDREPLLTRYKLSVVSNCRTLDIAAIKRDLGYQPLLTVAQGTDRFVAWWQAQTAKGADERGIYDSAFSLA